MNKKDEALRLAIETLEDFGLTSGDTYQACKAALSDAVTLPEVWKLVPIEPTREMLDNAHVDLMRDGEIDKLLKQVYAAMLSAVTTDKE